MSQKDYDRLRCELPWLELSEEEDKILRWLAMWDNDVITPLVGIFRRLKDEQEELDRVFGISGNGTEGRHG